MDAQRRTLVGELADDDELLEGLGGGLLGGLRGSEALARLLAYAPRATLRAVPGRETFGWPEEAPRVVVKRTRGDLTRDAWYERVMGRGRRSPGRREHDNLRALAAEGFSVPRALGWAEAADGTSLVVMEHVAVDASLSEHLAGAGEAQRRALLPGVVELVAGLHRRGWYHRDLYLGHLVLARGELVLLDVGRARRERAPRRRWFVKDLGALSYSTPGAVPPAWRLRFLAAYLDARGVRGRRRRRRWARDVEARRRSIAGHVPRYPG